MILSENWLHETVKLGKKVDVSVYNLGEAFKIYSQGDKAHFYQEVNFSKTQLIEDEKNKLKELLDGKASADQVIDECKEMTMQDAMLLEDFVLYSYDEDQSFRISQLCALTGATIL